MIEDDFFFVKIHLMKRVIYISKKIEAAKKNQVQTSEK